MERSEGKGYCGGYLGLPSESPSEGPTLHPAKVKGGVERGVPFMLFPLSTIFLTLESKFYHGHVTATRYEGHSLGQKETSCGGLKPLLAEYFWNQ